MKKFTEFVRESTPETSHHDAQEIKRQKTHLMDKAKEYGDQAQKEKHSFKEKKHFFLGFSLIKRREPTLHFQRSSPFCVSHVLPSARSW